MNADSSTSTYRFQGDTGAALARGLLAVGAALLVLVLVSFLFMGEEAATHVKFSYLTSFMYFLSIALGGLFFTLIHHLCAAHWSTVLRRLSEAVMMNLPLMAVLFIPILFWMHDLFLWVRPEEIEASHLLQHKQPYLNIPFFVLRAILYFGIWIGLATLMYRRSLRQDDTGKLTLLESMRRWSAPGMFLFAITITFAAFDWMMSLDPAWFSTIFGVYYFAGSAISIYAVLTLLSLFVNRPGGMNGAITVEHYHDLGKMMFGFVVFWAYIGFSQMMLIWMANVTEEMIWFFHRWSAPGWRAVSWILIFGHFVLPFLFLLPRTTKRVRPLLAFGAIWMLLMHYIDLFWLIFPAYDDHHVAFSPMIEPVLFLAMGCLFFGVVILRLRRVPLLPVRDPYLGKSLAFENVKV